MTTITGIASAPRSDEHAPMVAVAQQPVAVVVEASPDFQHYILGIFHRSCGSGINHAGTHIGYGQKDTDKYWIVKNS